MYEDFTKQNDPAVSCKACGWHSVQRLRDERRATRDAETASTPATPLYSGSGKARLWTRQDALRVGIRQRHEHCNAGDSVSVLSSGDLEVGRKTMQTAYFNRFSFDMPDMAISDCYHQGACDEDVDYWHSKIDLSHISDDDMAKELQEYGAWESEQLKDRAENEKRLIWLGAGNIQEEKENRDGIE